MKPDIRTRLQTEIKNAYPSAAAGCGDIAEIAKLCYDIGWEEGMYFFRKNFYRPIISEAVTCLKRMRDDEASEDEINEMIGRLDEQS